MLDFCLLHYLLPSDSRTMTLLILSSLLTELFRTFKATVIDVSYLQRASSLGA